MENLFGYGRKIKIMKKVLYTNGDSYTLGDELSNPRKSAWPYKLGSKLNCNKVINHVKWTKILLEKLDGI